MTTTYTPETIALAPGVAELAEWVKTLPSRDALTLETIEAEIGRRADTVDPAGNALNLFEYAMVRLAGTYDEFRTEGGL